MMPLQRTICTFRKVCFLVAFIFSAPGCQKSHMLQIHVVAIDNMDLPVKGAGVLINRKRAGTTDANGICAITYTFSGKSPLRIEIVKKSDIHYFAPYFKTFSYSSYKHKKKIIIRAVLYHAPKNPQIKHLEAMAGNFKEPDAQSKTTGSIPSGGALQEQNYSRSALSIDHQAPGLILPSVKKSSVKVLTGESPVGEKSLRKFGELAITDNFSRLLILPPFPVAEKKPEKPLPGYQRQVRSISFRLFVNSGSVPLKGAEVYLGHSNRGSLKFLCQTGKDGYCHKNAVWPQSGIATLKIKKNGFVTRTINHRIRSDNIIRTALVKGSILDIFIHRQGFSELYGVAGTDLFIDGRKVGQSDAFGHFVWHYTGASDGLIRLSLKNKNFLPEHFAADFVFGSSQTFRKTMVDKDRLKATLVIIGPLDFRLTALKGAATSFPELSRSLVSMAKKSGLFRMQPQEVFLKHIHKAGATMDMVLQKGWEFLNLRRKPDFLMIPFLITTGKEKEEEILLTLFDPKGRTIAAVRRKVHETIHQPGQNEELLTALLRQFPISLPVYGMEDSRVMFRMPQALEHYIDRKKEAHILRLIQPLSGQRDRQAQVAIGAFEEGVGGQVRLREEKPGVTFSRGDLLVFNRKKSGADPIRIATHRAGEAGRFPFFLFKGEAFIPLEASGDPGVWEAGGHLPSVKPPLELLTPGLPVRELAFEPSSGCYLIAPATGQGALSLILLETSPAGAKIEVPGQRTLSTPAVFVAKKQPQKPFQMHISGLPGYEARTVSLALQRSVISFRGPATIRLSPAWLHQATGFYRQKRWASALKSLAHIPDGHPDRAAASYMKGLILFRQSGRFMEAADAFQEVVRLILVKPPDKPYPGLWEARLCLASSLSALMVGKEGFQDPGVTERLQHALRELRDTPPSEHADQPLLVQQALLELISKAAGANPQRVRIPGPRLSEKWRQFKAIVRLQGQRHPGREPFLRYTHNLF